ncbi:hypothetical protein GCK72_003055 [Caenorhabditis remanei]|uniref:UDP-glucuronosyltransferase n=1 Tax=Caenorhabditis remanei TaxID=31234 RepID=A0A6A5HU15_CAERE|nr:hypothetical protein GCK72_003055 [Caenorhabditis remanei]KAF1771229.1 hypothetical protein GCK72_003055 [Caenorhabditis remanei]
MGNIADTLTEAGHNVTFLVPVADVTRRHEVGVKLTKNVMIVDRPNYNPDEAFNIDMDEVLRPLWTIQNRPSDFATCFTFFLEMMRTNCDDFTSNKKVFEELSKTKFDVAIAEPVSICGLGYFNALDIHKTILASSTTHYEGVVRNSGEPIDMSYVPVHGAYFDEKMSIFERYTNWAAEHVMAGNLEKMFDEEMEKYRKNLGVGVADWRVLIPEASVFFTNANQYIDFPRPVIQKTVGIGGITVDMEKIKLEKLPEEIEKILDKRDHNMLISFGSMVKSTTMPEIWRNSILSAIKKFPNITFIWKYESDDLKWAEGTENLYFLKWVPQTALLADTRLSGFLTHGGLGSTNELAYLGKPAIIVPIFGDQGRNGPMLARHGGAIVLNKMDLENSEVIADLMRKIVFDRSYAQKAADLANLLNSSPFSPKELVIKHTEFVGKFGPLTQMDPYIRKLNWFQRTFADVYILMFVFYSVVLIVPFLVVHKIYRLIF